MFVIGNYNYHHECFFKKKKRMSALLSMKLTLWSVGNIIPYLTCNERSNEKTTTSERQIYMKLNSLNCMPSVVASGH